VGFIDTGTRGLFDSEDAETLYEGMVPGSAVVALAIEHVWAVNLVNAIYAAGAELALDFRVPATIIDEAFASLEQKS
jgi:threonyl-tRNA synthetase